MVEQMTIPYWEVALRLVVTVALCGVIGFEREVRDQPAGFRTHILLGLGAALFTMVSAYGFPGFTRAALETGGRGIQFDPTRIAAQVVTGVGFLGAGAIIRQGRDIRGLTTAASLWAAAAVGLAAGAGYLFGAASTTAVVIATLFALRYFRGTVIERFRLDSASFSFSLSDPTADPSAVLGVLADRNITVRRVETEITKKRATYKLQTRVHPPRYVRQALLEISRLPHVERVSVTDLSDAEALFSRGAD